jgi:DNA-3-methyladenine glycosylase II
VESNLPKKVLEHFEKKDPVLAEYAKHAMLEELREYSAKEYFIKLVTAIIYQQLAGKAAQSIENRFLDLFENRIVTPDSLVEIDFMRLRSAGLSNAKAGYVQNIAKAFVFGDIIPEELSGLENEEIISKLTKIKGVGNWTAEMFLIFTLGRENIFSIGDLGIVNGIKILYQKKNISKKRLISMSKKWAPYQSYACRLFWHVADKNKNKNKNKNSE